MARIVAAMSGGVDSSVAAAMLAADAGATGDEVVGVWMRLHEDRGEGYELKRSCCSPDAADDARRVAQIAGIPFFVLNVERAFGERVIDAFTDAYLAGETPNPCSLCNQFIKFDELLRRGLATYGAEAVATGHYARIERDAGGTYRLLRATDRRKDQTYFLWMLTQEQLARSRFPLGGLEKPEVRRIAAQIGLPTADKPESQEICFVPLGDYRELLAERRGYAGEEGALVTADGARVGTHSGYAHFTVGQRRGLGVATGEPRYVLELRPDRNEVVVGPRADALTDRVHVRDARWIAASPPSPEFDASVKIRHHGPDMACRVRLDGDGDVLTIQTADPLWAAAPGQAAVLYRGDECLGGGRIARA
ncbi:MAG: tRNA 2-thiouridine(34) synthase MnmA [Chloroflexota bacterium]|nr:tRNA 2-thiouridine(34) synthase MnmA [Chloroflexota bacterium]